MTSVTGIKPPFTTQVKEAKAFLDYRSINVVIQSMVFDFARPKSFSELFSNSDNVILDWKNYIDHGVQPFESLASLVIIRTQ